MVEDKCGSLWFSRFMLGLQKRMGQIWKPNKALKVQQLVTLLTKADERFRNATTKKERNVWSSFLIYAAVSYVLSLRGTKGFMLDLESVRRLQECNDGTYFTIGLMGKIKEETNHRCHLLPCVTTTMSGINMKHVVMRHLRVKERQGLTSGPAISDVKGNILNSNDIDELLTELLEEMFEENCSTFPAEVDTKEKIQEFYHCYRTFRRSSDTQAMNMEVSGNDIDVINRWEKREKSGGKTTMGPMKQRYADFELLIKPFIRYGSKM